MSSIKLEIGKFYRQRNGEVVGPVENDNNLDFPFHFRGSGPMVCWTPNGSYSTSCKSDRDLVEEVREPTYDFTHEIDAVNRPAHYTAGGVECIDAIRAAMTSEQFKGFLRGNAMKYLWRHEHKGGIEDLHKAGWYLNKLVEVG